ncbi:MAG TPA: hypothetical protein VM901_03465 [Bdellovibrionota bacterium]|jgi:hypothetical protein|nr:hypothetical protein [Bdellovibrionota bacterium]
MSFSSKFLRHGIAVVLLVSLTGCKNFYSNFTHRTSTEYLIYDAERFIDNLQFDLAIINLDEVLSRDSTHEQALYLNSIAHSGRAGLRVISIFETVQDGGTSNLFPMLAASFKLMDDTGLADFALAVDYLETVAEDAADRTPDQNFYALFLYAGYIGAVLNRYAYNTSNTLMTANFSACHKVSNKAAVKTGIPDDGIDIIMTMIPRLIDTMDEMASSGSDTLIDTTALENLGTFSYDPIPCSANSNVVACRAVRSIVNNSSTGIGLGTGGPFGAEATVCAAVTP